ncbi:hypothetical protein BDAP_000143 [Binucleata daphniae]
MITKMTDKIQEKRKRNKTITEQDNEVIQKMFKNQNVNEDNSNKVGNRHENEECSNTVQNYDNEFIEEIQKGKDGNIMDKTIEHGENVSVYDGANNIEISDDSQNLPNSSFTSDINTKTYFYSTGQESIAEETGENIQSDTINYLKKKIADKRRRNRTVTFSLERNEVFEGIRNKETNNEKVKNEKDEKYDVHEEEKSNVHEEEEKGNVHEEEEKGNVHEEEEKGNVHEKEEKMLSIHKVSEKDIFNKADDPDKYINCYDDDLNKTLRCEYDANDECLIEVGDKETEIEYRVNINNESTIETTSFTEYNKEANDRRYSYSSDISNYNIVENEIDDEDFSNKTDETMKYSDNEIADRMYDVTQNQPENGNDICTDVKDTIKKNMVIQHENDTYNEKDSGDKNSDTKDDDSVQSINNYVDDTNIAKENGEENGDVKDDDIQFSATNCNDINGSEENNETNDDSMQFSTSSFDDDTNKVKDSSDENNENKNITKVNCVVDNDNICDLDVSDNTAVKPVIENNARNDENDNTTKAHTNIENELLKTNDINKTSPNNSTDNLITSTTYKINQYTVNKTIKMCKKGCSIESNETEHHCKLENDTTCNDTPINNNQNINKNYIFECDIEDNEIMVKTKEQLLTHCERNKSEEEERLKKVLQSIVIEEDNEERCKRKIANEDSYKIKVNENTNPNSEYKYKSVKVNKRMQVNSKNAEMVNFSNIDNTVKNINNNENNNTGDNESTSEIESQFISIIESSKSEVEENEQKDNIANTVTNENVKHSTTNISVYTNTDNTVIDNITATDNNTATDNITATDNNTVINITASTNFDADKFTRRRLFIKESKKKYEPKSYILVKDLNEEELKLFSLYCCKKINKLRNSNFLVKSWGVSDHSLQAATPGQRWIDG